MIKRDGNAEPVARAQTRANADRRAIVEDVAVRERDAFRPPRRAAGELDIDGLARVGGAIVQDRQIARRYIVKPPPSLGTRFVPHATTFQPGAPDRMCGVEGTRVAERGD